MPMLSADESAQDLQILAYRIERAQRDGTEGERDRLLAEQHKVISKAQAEIDAINSRYDNSPALIGELIKRRDGLKTTILRQQFAKEIAALKRARIEELERQSQVGGVV